MRKYAIILAGALALAACQQAAEAPEQADESAGVEAATKETVDLGAGGIVVPAQAGDEQLEVPFGSQREAAEASLAAVLGDVVERGEMAECPAGVMMTTAYEGLTLYFQDGKFVGWFTNGTYLPSEMRSEFEETGAIRMVDESTLGTEFVFGEEGGPTISGLFSDESEDAQVTNLWAGTVCNFR